jgi:hypothetical protein
MSCQETMTGSRQALVFHVLPSSALCFSISVFLNVVAIRAHLNYWKCCHISSKQNQCQLDLKNKFAAIFCENSSAFDPPHYSQL